MTFGRRRLCLVLGVICIAMTTLLCVLPSKLGSMLVFHKTSLTYVKSVNFTTPSVANIPQNNLSFTENREILQCIVDFPKLIFEQKLINRPIMEKTRVNSHSYLNSKSRVLEVGGYTGQDAAKLIRMYDPHYVALEPIPRYQKILMERFKQNPKFHVLGIGLGRENKTLHLNIDSDATSLYRKNRKSHSTVEEVAHIRELTEVFKELRVDENPVDLLTINCEGCEYELLEVLVASQLVHCFRNIQFQFHLDLPGITDQERRYCTIMTLLSRTHHPYFQFSYTWQSWRRTGQ